MLIYKYKGKEPQIADSAYIADQVVITGDVIIGEEASIWFNTVIRGDVEKTIIGNRVNIQDNTVIHQSPGLPVIIEDDVTIGHQCILHAASIRKGSLIGMGTTVLDGAEIGEGAFIGAGSLVVPNQTIPPNTLALGRPAKIVRELTEKDKQEMRRIAEVYVEKGKYYKSLKESSQE